MVLEIDPADASKSLSSDRACLQIGLGYWAKDDPKQPGFHYLVWEHLDQYCYSLHLP
ncbi:MAG: hypothetical protein ACREUU_07120 [Gammaproteobacteria bacterium]